MRNYFTFGEYDSRDFGVFIARDGVYNAPRHVYNTYSVPGRNGNLLVDQNYLENIEVAYPACIYAGFDANLAGLRSALLSQKGYVRIMDSYHPDEYRLGVYMNELSVVPTVLGDGGTFEVVFNCKPQRFLLSGETSTTLSASGSITNPTLFASRPLVKITPTPTSDNLIPYPYPESGTVTKNGVTFVENSGTITASGTASSTAQFGTSEFTLQEGEYKLSGCSGESGCGIYMWVYYNSAWRQIASLTTSGSVDVEITEAYAGLPLWIACAVLGGRTVTDVRFQPVLAAKANSAKLVKIGDQKIYVANAYPYVIIDSELQDCYRGVNNLNSQVTFDSNEFPVLEPGENTVEFSSNIQSVEITPRWFIV